MLTINDAILSMTVFPALSASRAERSKILDVPQPTGE
jgi:hypothetical protein